MSVYHGLSPFPRTNSDSALHQSTMTPTQPDPFMGGSQDAHQKRGMSRACGPLCSGQASPAAAPVLPEVTRSWWTDLRVKEDSVGAVGQGEGRGETFQRWCYLSWSPEASVGVFSAEKTAPENTHWLLFMASGHGHTVWVPCSSFRWSGQQAQGTGAAVSSSLHRPQLDVQLEAQPDPGLHT